MPISMKRWITPAASVEWIDESTRWPVSADLTTLAEVIRCVWIN